jgi:hypothetical protein
MFMSKYEKNNYFNKLNESYLSRLEVTGGRKDSKPTKVYSFMAKGKGKSISLVGANDRTSDDS